MHPSHKTRFSDASSFDEICTLCGATDGLGTWGKLALPCPKAEAVEDDYIPFEGRAYPGVRRRTFNLFGDAWGSTETVMTKLRHKRDGVPNRLFGASMKRDEAV